MKQTFKVFVDKQTRNILFTVLAVLFIFAFVSFMICRHTLTAEAQIRYIGLKNVISEKFSKTIGAMEMSAENVFDEVGKHMDSPEAVVTALKSKTHLNPEVRGYFAAFEPEYFPQKGTWFEPYIHHSDSSEFEYSQVGSARHDYTKSDWYVRAKQSSDSFWSDPYYYYDGTNMSGHYATFVKPIFDSTGRLACVCGADITFDWATKELQRIDNESKNDSLLNMGHLYEILDFYSVIIDKGGYCIVHPEGKSVPLTKEQARVLTQQRSGMMDLEISGVPSTLYYSPIEHVDWTVALVVTKQDMQKTLFMLGLVFFLIMLIGIIVVWVACSRVTGK
ncbi:MAG: hypothetical protein J6W38_06665 [Prevotella sp.]|nr:hypothetical protein [Prevotella sp.]MBO7130122.1 hypothetical protein [Prevotella sp.]